jgi:hypothetical protein
LSRLAYPCPPISGSRRDNPGGAASRAGKKGREDAAPIRERRRPSESTRASHARPGLAAHAELGTGESVGSSPREVNILNQVRAGTKYAGFLLEIRGFFEGLGGRLRTHSRWKSLMEQTLAAPDRGPAPRSAVTHTSSKSDGRTEDTPRTDQASTPLRARGHASPSANRSADNAS